jgi:hypothetical protein
MAKTQVQKPFEPWAPADLSLKELCALQDVARGTAQPHQQKLAMDTIVYKLARTYQQSFCPGVDGARNSDFSEGMRRVGTMLVTFLNADRKKFKDPDAAPTEQP